MALDETAGRRQGSGLRGAGNRCGQAESQGGIVGIDRWAKEYASFSKSLRESNARAEGVSRITFQKGDASHLDFPGKTFDAMGSNYLYQTSQASDIISAGNPAHVEKGGSFALHDIFSRPGTAICRLLCRCHFGYRCILPCIFIPLLLMLFHMWNIMEIG